MAAGSHDNAKAEDVTPGEEEAEGTALPELKPAVTREKHDAPVPEPPEADDFGLPVKPPRRRNYSLEELESPEAVKAPPLEGLEGTKEDVGKSAESTIPTAQDGPRREGSEAAILGPAKAAVGEERRDAANAEASSSRIPRKLTVGAESEWSHQQLAPHVEAAEDDGEEEKWQEMPALAEHRIYDDWGKVLAKSYDEVDNNEVAYGNLGGAGKGYTRVQVDDDAQSATSLDDNTAYLFKDQPTNTLVDEDEDGKDAMAQMQMTKELLTEGQRIAYVGVVRLAIKTMAAEIEALDKTKGTKKNVELAAEAMKMWSQKMMVRLYKHMDIDSQEQVMVEQLADHGVRPEDLTPTLMANARVKNPQNVDSETLSEVNSTRPSVSSPRPTLETRTSTPIQSKPSTPRPPSTHEQPSSTPTLSKPSTPSPPGSAGAPPPAYQEHAASDLTIQDPSEITTKNIDLDLRWTVLCDLFLLLIADSTYDSRSRTLLERVGAALAVEWQEICRFEKRVTDALEMQEQADKENWNEEDHMKSREKRARNKRLMVMGLCTVGGGLVIGLSAGMLAPVIGAGLAAGFTGLGVAGTGGFLGGTGAAALIGTTGSLIGGHIGMKGASRRTGAVRTFEYRPLFNNKRVNLIVTVSGWMAGKVDDVRLPFSTVDPIMGDIYSVNWEPDMLQSTGETIQILGTEALTQTIQQILGATFLATLMAGLSLPIVLTKLAYLIDNPWTVSLARADSTGLILADSLIDRNLGVRPITLVGFSLGSRVIFSCLKELARRGALGLVQNVYIFGSPVVVKKDEWTRARTVVSGRFVNGYATNDWILAYLFRATSGGVGRVAGLATVELPGVENIDVTENVPGHMAYRGMMPTLLHEVGWAVESEEFTEIEDPDPENHEKRQRELIKEIEEARREAEGKPERKGFKAFFSRGKKARRKADWETYDERSAKGGQGEVDREEVEAAAAAAAAAGESESVMFDVDAIRREALQLAVAGGDMEEIKGHMRIKEIESTMPVLKISSPPALLRCADGTANGVVNGGASTPNLHAADGRTTPNLLRAQSYNGSAAAAAGMNGANGHSTPAAAKSRHDRDDHDDGYDDHDVTMSFEAHDRSSPSPYANGVSSSSSPYHHSPAPSYHEEPEQAHWTNAPSHTNGERPALRSVSTMPAGASSHQSPVAPGSSADHNPWAEEEEFGRERDMEMSFE